MNVTVLNAEGLPESVYLSIRIGETRRQAPYHQNEQLYFPSSNSRALVLDVFQKIGTAQTSLVGLSEKCGNSEQLEGVNIARIDGGGSMKVNFKVEVSEQSKTADESGTKKQMPSKTSSRHHSAVKAKGYLDAHGVQTVLQDMVHCLLKMQPEDPLAFMSTYVAELRARAAQQNAATAPPGSLQEYSSMPGLGDGEYPGFPVDVAPAQLPDICDNHCILAGVLRQDQSLYGRLRERQTSRCVRLSP
eukprot:gnl/TRDRNA2_/TRDRNA2_169664_c1_seq1.p1 gnl/TRDRNA2_/TRDRNA2_169664_c1~~gnl/TRDRNA2_/TRDRNA2_169664_c1_seq1.p1  ORF type:complete len:246 (-),score=46.58 gnl/TRDRNA2_/TRDRNA2_169664_c1_seq1:15-752(-)